MKPASGFRLSAFGLSFAAFLLVTGFQTGHAQQGPVGVQEPAWAPDGKRIAVSYLDRLWTMTPDGKQAKVVPVVMA